MRVPLFWEAEADLESGLAYFIIEQNGLVLGQVPGDPRNRFGRPLFQGLQYSDTPTYPLVQMRFSISLTEHDGNPKYRVRSVNTVGLESN